MQSDDPVVSAYDVFRAVWTQIMSTTRSSSVIVVEWQQDGELVEDIDVRGRELRVHEAGERRQREVVSVVLRGSGDVIPERRRLQHDQSEL